MTADLKDADFQRLAAFLRGAAGIHLSLAKKSMLAGRLAKRLQALGMDDYGAYAARLEQGDEAEAQQAVDLLTTNETYFFREARHFELLAAHAARAPAGRPFRVWSAACSSGEEVYGLAMVLAETLGETTPWDILGSDISQRVLARARSGHYPMTRTQHLPPEYLKRYCRRGIGPQEGTLLIDRRLRARVQFQTINLNEPLPALGEFDAVFLRNVMIYFERATKRQVVPRVLGALRPGGLFFIGHSESLNDVLCEVDTVAPSAYRKRGGAAPGLPVLRRQGAVA